MLFFGAESHDILDTSTVVPTSVEDDDLTGRRKVGQVALHVHLALFAVRRRGKRNHAKYARTDALRDRPDSTALASPIASLKHQNYPQTLELHPILEPTQLDLKLPHFFFVLFTA